MCGVACVSQCCRHICNWFNIATKSSYGQQPVIMKVWLSLFDIIETGFWPLSPFFDGLNIVLFFLASCYLFQPVLWCMVLHILQNRKRSTFPLWVDSLNGHGSPIAWLTLYFYPPVWLTHASGYLISIHLKFTCLAAHLFTRLIWNWMGEQHACYYVYFRWICQHSLFGPLLRQWQPVESFAKVWTIPCVILTTGNVCIITTKKCDP